MQLEIYRVGLSACAEVAGLVRKVGREDPDLARQLRRAVQSVPLNIAEGESAVGGNRRLRFATAKGSAKESIACLEVAVAMGSLEGREIARAVDRLTRIIATLTVLAKR